MSFFVKKELPSDFLIFNGMVGKMLEKWLKIVIYIDQ